MSVSEQILQAKPEEMSDIILAYQKRHAELFPEWEFFSFVLEKVVDKNQQLDDMIRLLEKLKEW